MHFANESCAQRKCVEPLKTGLDSPDVVDDFFDVWPEVSVDGGSNLITRPHFDGMLLLCTVTDADAFAKAWTGEGEVAKGQPVFLRVGEKGVNAFVAHWLTNVPATTQFTVTKGVVEVVRK